MIAHVFFSNGPNFWLATFAFAVEGCVAEQIRDCFPKAV